MAKPHSAQSFLLSRSDPVTFMWPSRQSNVTFLWPSCDLHVTFLWPSCNLRVTFIWPSCDCRATFIWPSCQLHITLVNDRNLSSESIRSGQGAMSRACPWERQEAGIPVKRQWGAPCQSLKGASLFPARWRPWRYSCSRNWPLQKACV